MPDEPISSTRESGAQPTFPIGSEIVMVSVVFGIELRGDDREG